MSATELALLQTRKLAVLTEISELTNPNTASSHNAGSVPNRSGACSIDHIGYKKSLYEELAQIEERINAIEGGWEIISEVDC